MKIPPPTNLKLENYPLEEIVKNRARLLEEYNKQGFKRFEKILKKSKKLKKIKTMNVDEIYQFIIEKFDNIFDSLFFVFYFFTNFEKQNNILQRRNSSFIFSQVFKGLLEFLNFNEMGSLNLISVKDEVILFYFTFYNFFN